MLLLLFLARTNYKGTTLKNTLLDLIITIVDADFFAHSGRSTMNNCKSEKTTRVMAAWSSTKELSMVKSDKFQITHTGVTSPASLLIFGSAYRSVRLCKNLRQQPLRS